MTTWTDAEGHALTDYPRPSVAVDVAVLTYHDGALKVLVVEHSRGMLALPGTFLHPAERLSDAAERALRTKAGLEGVEFHQLAMFDEPERDDRGWVLSMAHGTAVPAEGLPPGALLVSVAGGEVDSLAFDHTAMVALAVADLRARYSCRVDPSGLLGEQFTVLELRRLYEVVFGRDLPKDTFRRHVVDALVSTGEMSSTGNGRPAEVFRRREGAQLAAGAAAMLSINP